MNQTLVSSLRPEVQAKLHPEQVKRLNYIDNADYSMVYKKVGKELARRGQTVTAEYLESVVQALKQYYAVALLDPANAHAVSLNVDDAWHVHLLDTEGYKTFCEAVVGEVMPHVHLDHDNKDQVENVATLYSYTLETLDKLFTHVSAEMWPSPEGVEELICYHKGNEDVYPQVQQYRLFEPTVRGQALAFA